MSFTGEVYNVIFYIVLFSVPERTQHVTCYD